MADLSDDIEAAAQKPKSASTDAGSVEQQPIADKIAADQYLAAKAAAKGKKRGLVFQRLKSPGTVEG